MNLKDPEKTVFTGRKGDGLTAATLPAGSGLPLLGWMILQKLGFYSLTKAAYPVNIVLKQQPMRVVFAMRNKK